MLVRRLHLFIHKRLGLISILLIPVMAVTAALSEVNSQRFYLDHPPDSQAFFIIPLFYIFAFTPLAVGAVLARGNPAMHKRLILSATTIIVGAAYARWWGHALTKIFGADFVGTIINTFTGTNLIMLAALAYDWTTRRQLHRVYLFVVPAIIIGELAASYIYHSPQ